MKVDAHRKMGRFYGGFYYLPDGRGCYIAHRKRTEVFRAKNAWTIDLSTLNECRERGIAIVGVVTYTKTGGYFFYLTPLEDFFGVNSFAHFGDTRQRGLPITKFRLNPSIIPAIISKAVRVK